MDIEITDLELYDWISRSTIGGVIFQQCNQTSLSILEYIDVDDYESCMYEKTMLQLEMNSWAVVLTFDLEISLERILEALHMIYDKVLELNKIAIQQK
jgi:hypothetical protein